MAANLVTDEAYSLRFVTLDGLLIGSICYNPNWGGYRFIPATSSRKASTKVWPSAVSCIPAWAERIAGDRGELVTSGQWTKRQRVSA